jgi:hypothetical protein
LPTGFPASGPGTLDIPGKLPQPVGTMRPVAAHSSVRLAWLVLVLAGWLGAPVAQALAPPMAEDCDHCQVVLTSDDCQVTATHISVEPAPSPARDRSDTTPPALVAGFPEADRIREAGIRPHLDPPPVHRSRHLIFSRFLE